MSKETYRSDYCAGCGNDFAFIQFHAPHCPRLMLPAAEERASRRVRAIAKQTADAAAASLAQGMGVVAAIVPIGGGMKDQRVGKKRPAKKKRVDGGKS
jgi:hypothetical protein